MSSIAIPGSDYKYGSTTRERPRTLNRLLLFFTLLLATALLAELGFHFVVGPRLTIRHIEMNVGKGFPLSDAEIVRLAGLDQPVLYYAVSPERIAANLETYPLVKSAAVEKVFPNVLRITIVERNPLVISLVESEAHVVPVAFDSGGVAIEVGRSVTDYNMPVISGITIPQARLGMHLPPELVGFLREVAALKESAPALYSLISEIRFVKEGVAGFDAVLFLSNYHVPVKIGERINENLLKYVMMVLDVAQKQGMLNKLAELDFRTGQVVYKLKEGM